jgi:hypothetical protein
MKTTTPNRFIRWLIALMGGDPNRTPVPLPRRHIDITVERQGDTHVAIIKNGNGQPPTVGYTNVVYLIGEVKKAVDGREEIEIITDSTKKTVRVYAAAGLHEVLRNLREGDLVMLIGEVEASRVRATRLHRINQKRRERMYG